MFIIMPNSYAQLTTSQQIAQNDSGGHIWVNLKKMIIPYVIEI